MGRRTILLTVLLLTLIPGCATEDPDDPNEPVPMDCVAAGPLFGREAFFSGGAADQNFVYVGDSTGRVWRIRLSDATTENIGGLDPTDAIRAVTLDGGIVFLAATRQGTETRGGGGRIFSMSAGGGRAIELASGLNVLVAIAADAAHVYWLDRGILTEGEGFRATGTLQRVVRGGGRVETLAADLSVPHDVALDGASVYFSADGTSVPPGRGGVFRVLKSGGAVEEVTTADSARGIAVDGGSVYFTTLDQQGAAQRAPKSGGAPNFTYTTGLPSPSAVSLLGATMYFVGDSDGSGSVHAVAAGGGEPSLVTEGLNAPQALTSTVCGMVVSTHREVRLLRRV